MRNKSLAPKWSAAEIKFLADNYSRIYPAQLVLRLNEIFHAERPVRTITAVHQRACVMGVTKRTKRAPSVMIRKQAKEARETAAEVALWERERKGRATVKTPTAPGITRAMIMSGRA